ncbi:uncharacterized protein [Mycetomoellerius zeteki]|uniref:uncharacterized protein n=1 Tax=Mycetomoellerius zeteki TaxID=64791 RepID=UPI00084E8025|nr:PREDICTED: uncharacterized protein LOC108722208 [Trachymyrmex zeteki]
MKIFMWFFMYLLAVTYAKTAKPEGIDILCENLNKCKNKIPKYGNLHIDKMYVDQWHCALKKVDVINKENIIIRKKAIDYCEAVMPKQHVESCQKIVIECIDEGYKELVCGEEKCLSNLRKSLYQVACTIIYGVTRYIDCNKCNVTEENA